MPVLVAVLDADVLVPIVPCDFLLSAFDLGLYEPVVSTAVIEEVERTLAEDFPNLTPEAVRYRVEAMRSALEDQLVTPDPDAAPDAVNAKDRHVVAAAQAGEAAALVSNDRRLRGQVTTAADGIDALSLDEFALRLWKRSPKDVNRVIDALVAKRQRPPVTRAEMLDALAGPLPSLIAAIRSMRESTF